MKKYESGMTMKQWKALLSENREKRWKILKRERDKQQASAWSRFENRYH